MVKYILFFSLCFSNLVFAQMPNLKTNKANVPTSPFVNSQENIFNKNNNFINIMDEDVQRDAVYLANQEDEGNIFIAYGDIKYDKTIGGQRLCFVTIKLRNNTIYNLSSLKMKFVWPSWSNPVTFSNFAVSEENFITYRIAGASCDNLDGNPKISLLACSVADLSLAQCGKMIKMIPFSEF